VIQAGDVVGIGYRKKDLTPIPYVMPARSRGGDLDPRAEPSTEPTDDDTLLPPKRPT
jgi:hypothetical protein